MIIVILILTIMTGKAQCLYPVKRNFFVQGDIGTVSHMDIKWSGSGSPSSNTSNSYSITPRIGYWLSDKFAIGAGVSFLESTTKDMVPDPNNQGQEVEIVKRSPTWEFFVFSRYKIWDMEKLSLQLESSVGVLEKKLEEKGGSTTQKTSLSYSEYRVGIVPLISYDLTNKVSIIAQADFFSLNFAHGTLKYPDIDQKRTSNVLEFGARKTTIGGFLIGFTYNF